MLMKNEISIITPHSVYNYGAMLQAYGIYQFIKKNGYDVGVYLELLRRGNKVFVGKVDHFEVDFVAQNSKGIEYYQVALTVRDEKTLQRELRHLQAIQELP